MLKSKKELDEFLTEEITKKSFDKYVEPVVEIVYRDHKIPKGNIKDYLATRNPLQEADEITEFCILDGIIKATVDSKHTQAAFVERMEAYYTAIEKQKYKGWKFEDKIIKWPLKIPCFPVGDDEDQWIGVIDTQFIMLLRKAQLIRYNQNAQRVMKRIITRDKTEYVISINKKAVNEIEECYRERIFIPNTWTFNIPDDVEYNYRYSKDNKELVFSSLDCFDIIDGYHRFLAACTVFDEDDTFNLPIELRITRFSDEKARDFIRQEDHKTQMLKIDSESMDSHSPANFTVERLNTDSQSNLRGLIKRNGDIINYSALSSCLSKYLYKGEKIPKRQLILITSKIEEFYNRITNKELSLLEYEWPFVLILSTVLLMDYISITEDELSVKNYEKLNLNDIIRDLFNYIENNISRTKITPSTKLYHVDLVNIREFLDKKIDDPKYLTK